MVSSETACLVEVRFGRGGLPSIVKITCAGHIQLVISRLITAVMAGSNWW